MNGRTIEGIGETTEIDTLHRATRDSRKDHSGPLRTPEFLRWLAHMPNPKHPHIQVVLSGTDGNAFAVLGTVARALREAGVSPDEVSAFHEEATRGDYDHLLRTVMGWVEVV